MEKGNYINEEFQAGDSEDSLHWQPVAKVDGMGKVLAEKKASGLEGTADLAEKEMSEITQDAHKNILKQVHEHHQMYVDLWLSHLKSRRGR